MIEVEHQWIGLPAIDARVFLQVVYQKISVPISGELRELPCPRLDGLTIPLVMLASVAGLLPLVVRRHGRSIHRAHTEFSTV